MGIGRLLNKYFIRIPEYLFVNQTPGSYYTSYAARSYATSTSASFNIGGNRASSPMHPVQFYNRTTRKWVSVDLLSDTGADYTVMNSRYAEILGLPETSPNTAQVTSGTGLSNKQFYMHKIIMRIGNMKPVIALVTIGPNVINALGRNGGMDKYSVTYTKDTVTYRELTNPSLI